MTGAREELEKLLKQLEQQRDELRLKMSLAKLEARGEWEKLEKQWNHLAANAPKMRDEIGATAGNVGASLKKTAEELKAGYERLRKLL